MRENLILAIGYNAVAVPIAILGLASPLVAALAMSGSSLIVALNAAGIALVPVPGRLRELQRFRIGCVVLTCRLSCGAELFAGELPGAPGHYGL